MKLFPKTRAFVERLITGFEDRTKALIQVAKALDSFTSATIEHRSVVASIEQHLNFLAESQLAELQRRGIKLS
jgi:Na+-translocating ferredoxin:NAD+ oxidoreductase RnfG subunit